MKLLVADYFYKDAKDYINSFVKNPDDIIVLSSDYFDLIMNTVTTSYMIIIEEYVPNYLERFEKYILDKEDL